MIHKGFFKLALLAVAAGFCLSAQSAMASRNDRQIAMTKCSRGDSQNVAANGNCAKCNKCESCPTPCKACPEKKCEACPCPESCEKPCPTCPSSCESCPSNNGMKARKGAAKSATQGN